MLVILETFLLMALLLQHCTYLLATAVPAKRASVSGGASNDGSSSSLVGPGQPEEIFTLDNRLESNYDEYPMVVPKRAALLLDRLMVALHHALEKERQKIDDFYDEAKFLNNNNKHAFNQQRLKDKNNNIRNQNDETNTDDNAGGGAVAGERNLMYSDDDPNVLLDYDFKDLNAINRATGQTLPKNFQRRGHGDGLALLRSPIVGDGGGGADINASNAGFFSAAAITKLNDDIVDALKDDDGRSDIGGGGSHLGRMYWRCYFNAVSCF